MKPGWFDELANPWADLALVGAIDRSRVQVKIVPAPRRATDREATR